MKILKKISTKHLNSGPIEWKGGTLPYKSISDTKYVLRLDDKNIIEAAVYDLFINCSKIEKHACISIQVGCKFGCRMCSSGKSGYIRDLNFNEILQEISILSKEENYPTFDLLSFMGIGEPCDNTNNFLKSIHNLIYENNDYLGKVSFATICIPKQLMIISNAISTNFIPPFKMVWVSLNAADNNKRKTIMPYKKISTVEKVINSSMIYAKKHLETDVWLNYIIYKEFNDTIEDSKNLAKLLKGTKNHISLMLTEPNNPFYNYQKANKDDLEKFKILLIKHNVENNITLFRAAGKDINAGCGEFILTPFFK